MEKQPVWLLLSPFVFLPATFFLQCYPPFLLITHSRFLNRNARRSLMTERE